MCRLAAFTSVLLLAATSSAQNAVPLTSEVKSPVEPEKSLEHLVLDYGGRVELVAAEPDVIDPVAVRFDENGRMWVVEMRDYPWGPKEGEEPKSVIKTLEDKDGDGRFESVTVFADKLLFVTGVQPWRGGVIVTMAGQVAFMKDTDDDGRADQTETWYTGFAQDNSQLRANHPRFGLDNRIYIANGLRGGKVVDPRDSDSQPLDINGKDFRFDPVTFEYEALTGAGQFGLSFDDFGNRFICSNRNPVMHVVLEDRYIRRNPAYAPPAARHDVAASGPASRLYPITRSWTTSNLHAGQFTAACGVLIYRGNGLTKMNGHSLTCDPTAHVVHRERRVRQGATYSSESPHFDAEFLASRDAWFSPVNLAHGPDGALYVVDMYRAVIEHPRFVPDELKERKDMYDGIDRGRIYRITARPESTNRATPALGEMTSKSLAGLLDHPNSWQRDTAARLLFERQDKSVASQLADLVGSGRQPSARVLALWQLHGLGELTDDTIIIALGDEDEDVRQQAIAVAESRLNESPTLRDHMLRLARDEAANVRFQLAISLAPWGDSDEELAALRSIALAARDDVWMRRAVAIAAGMQASRLVISILQDPPWAGGKATPAELELLTELITLAAADEKHREGVLAEIAAQTDELSEQLQRVGLQAFARGLVRQRTSLAALLKVVDQSQLEPIAAIFAQTRDAAADRDRPVAERTEALDLLFYDSDATEMLAKLAVEESQRDVRTLAINALARRGVLDPWKTLLSRFSSEAPGVRRAIVAGLLARADRTTLLLDEIEAGRIKVAELDRSYTNRLLGHGDAAIKKRAQQLLAAAIPEDRQKVLADYQPVLKMEADAKRGQQVFTKNCATCHRIGTIGVDVAPDISDSRTKQPAQLLTDILQPNRAIDNNYISYSVITADGRSLTGVIASDTAASITLRQQEGKNATLARGEIDEMRSNGISLMPEGLEKNIPQQAMADLIAFIKHWRYLDGLTPLGEK